MSYPWKTGNILSMENSIDQSLARCRTSLERHSRVWKLFEFTHGSFLLHLQTAYIFSIDSATAHSLRTSLEDEQFLQNLSQGLPVAPQRRLEEIDITNIALNVEQSCNLRCVYCYAGDGDYGRDSTMSFAKATAIIESLAQNKPHFHIHFFGGEPLLNFALIRDLVLWCEQREATKFRFSLTTNGMLLRDQIAEFLKMHRVSVTISYDGKGVQEQQRKSKDGAAHSSDYVRTKILKYQDDLSQLPNFKVRSTFAREQIEKFASAMADSLRSFDGQLSFAPAFSDKFGNSYSLAETELLAKQLVALVEGLLTDDDFDAVVKISSIRSFVRSLHKGRLNLNACSAGINYISVSTAGKYYLCHRFTEDSNAEVGDFKKGVDLTRLERIRHHRLGLQEPCNSCWMKNWCGGGCFHDNKVANNDELVIDRRFCLLQDTEINLAMKVYTVLLAKRPELLED